MSDPVALCRRLQDELFGGARLEVADQLLSSDFLDHEAGADAPRGPESARRTVRWLHAAFSEIHYEVDDVFAAGDRVAMRCRMSGRQTGEFFGVPATGRRFTAQQIHLFRLDGGKVAEHWACRDDLGMLRQLGSAVAS